MESDHPMSRLIERSTFLALICVFATSLVGLGVCCGLNPRFVDSIPHGMLVFLLAPIAGAVPLAVLAWLLCWVGMQRDAQRHCALFITITVATLMVPPLIFLVHPEVSSLFGNRQSLTFLFELGIALIVLLGSRQLASVISPWVFRLDQPRWSVAVGLVVAILVAVPVAAFRSNRPIQHDGRSHLVIFGVDGATWKIIDPLIAQGDLPTFSQLLEEGTRFELASIEPLMSPILWTTIASGVGPEAHGIKSFFDSSDEVKVPRLWDIAEQNGADVGMLGWPVTWPPREVNGFQIPSLFARGPETYPPELQFVREVAMSEKQEDARDLRTYVGYGFRSIEYGVKLSTLVTAVRVMVSDLDYLEATSAKRFLKLDIHSDIFLELWERYQPQFGTFYDNAPDVMCHYFWKYHEPAGYPDVGDEDVRRYGDVINESYRRADASIAKILRFLPEDTQIVVLSDHGLEGIETAPDGTVRIIRAEAFLKALRLEKNHVGVNLRNLVYIRPANPEMHLSDTLESAIGEITILETGEPIFLAFSDPLGNLQVHVRDGVELTDKHLRLPDGSHVLAHSVIRETPAQMSGIHDPDGILLIKGPDTPAGSLGGAATILDVAPTVAYMMGFPVEANMKGATLERAFSEDRVRREPPRKRTYTIGTSSKGGGAGDLDDDEALKATLRALGYIQ